MKTKFFLIASFLIALSSCSDGKGVLDTTPIPIPTPSPEPGGDDDGKTDGIYDPTKVTTERVTVFNSGNGTDIANAYRIPSLVTAPDGQLLAFGEARWDGWADKSRTDVVMKVGSADGKVWSEAEVLTPGGATNAYMDPCAVADATANKVFLFAVQWPDKTGANNKAYCVTIEKVGQTWKKTEIKDVSDLFNTADKSRLIGGFGPGSGLQMNGDKYAGRLIVPVRLSKWDAANAKCVSAGSTALYSTDHGATWKLGDPTNITGEFQIAESPKDNLIYNMRNSTQRLYGSSSNGGQTWSNYMKYQATDLPVPDKGCQGSVLGKGDILYYTGPEGITAGSNHDSRGRLVLCQSKNGGVSWDNASRVLLYEKAAGYSCMTFTKDGRLAVLAEVGDEPGFINTAGDQGKRPAGWMRLDIILLNQN